MILLRDNTPIPPACFGAILAVGNFDGLHLGHRAVINKALELAGQAKKPVGVMTFEPHPRRIFQPHLPVLRIIPLKEKIRLLREMGIDFLRIVRFTAAFAKTSAPEFVTHILQQQLCASHIVTGEDFVFGHNREGNAERLRVMAMKQGFKATACAPVEIKGSRCSSTRIRDALALGNVELAARLLGRLYSISGVVRQGDKRGRLLGFPTANLFPPPLFLPAFGVYAVRVMVQGKQVLGVANLGVRPTFGGSRVRLEVHLFDWQENIYGEHIDVAFMQYIRPEQKFEGIETLKAQIARDCEMARALFKADA